MELMHDFVKGCMYNTSGMYIFSRGTGYLVCDARVDCDAREPLFDQVKSFCEAYGISVPNMNDVIGVMGKSVRRKHTVTQHHYYKVDIFNAALDATMNEMNHRFNEVSSELLVCMSCLDPSDSFSKFNVDKLIRLTEI